MTRRINAKGHVEPKWLENEIVCSNTSDLRPVTAPRTL